jgi:hypothetical protein
MTHGLPLRLLTAGRAVFGETVRALGNPSWDEASSRILIARLSPFRDVDRSSAHLILFAETRAALPRAYIDFAFMPDRGDRELLAIIGERRGTPQPWFFGASSGASLAAFDLVLVSNAFGLELVNLPRLFSTADLPLRASLRARGAGPLPLVVLGGSNAGQCGALVDDAGDSLVDGIFVGEGEGAIGPLAAILADTSRSRAERLEAAASIEGFWPALHTGRRVRHRRLAVSPPPLLSWPPFDGPEAGTTRLQVTAGCPGHCSFCFEGWDRRTYRELPFEAVLAGARDIRARNGADTLEIYSFNFNTHSDIASLLYELGRIFRTVNLMSQRLDVLADTPGLMAAELAADKRSFTLGIEGISARMRAFYRKGLDEATMERLVAMVVAPGVRELKLFYILAGFEEDSDLAEFEAFAARLGARRASLAPGLRILVSAGYLVRLPGTPLRHAPLVLEAEPFARVVKALEASCATNGLEWRVAVHFDEFRADQLLSLAGASLLPWLESLADPDIDEVYDGNLGRGLWKSLETFASRRGILSPAFLAEKSEGTAPTPAFLDESASAGALWGEYLEARAFVDRVACLGGSCADCGACEEPGDRIFLTRHRIAPATRADIERLTRLLTAKRAFARLWVVVDRPVTLSGAGSAAQGAWLLGRLAATEAEAWRSVYSANLVFPAPGVHAGMVEGAYGLAVFSIEGPTLQGLEDLASRSGLRAVPALPEEAGCSLEIHFPLDFAEAAILAGKAEWAQEGQPARLVAAWLARSHLAFTERHDDEGRTFEIAAKHLARRAVYSATARGDTLRLELGPKARIDELLVPLGDRLGALPELKVEGWSER